MRSIVPLVLVAACSEATTSPPPTTPAPVESTVAPSPTDPLACMRGDKPSAPDGRFMCRVAIDGVARTPFPCEVANGILRLVDGTLACYVTATIANNAIHDGYLRCPTPSRTAIAMFDAPLRAVSGGFRADVAKAYDASFEAEARGESGHPLPPMAIAFVMCREPWPAGFVSDFDRP